MRLFSKIFFLSKGSPFSFYDILQQKGCLKIPKGPPLSFSALRLFENLFFSLKGPPFNCDKSVGNFGSVLPFSAPGARASGPRRATRSIFLLFEYCKLKHGSPFAIFEPWIRRRLGPVPACFLTPKKCFV